MTQSLRNKSNPWFAKENHVKLPKSAVSKEYVDVPGGGGVTYPVGGTGSADFANDALDSGWVEGDPLASGYDNWVGWKYENGQAVAEFAAADNGDPGTDSLAGQQCPRLTYPVGNVDFQIDYAVASPIYKDQSGSSQYVGTGFFLEFLGNISARMDVYRLSGNDDSSGYRNLYGSGGGAGDPINANGTSRGHPGFFRMTRVGNTYTIYNSYDGVNFVEIDSFSDTSAVLSVGVIAYKIGTAVPATIKFEYIHINQTGGFSLPNEVNRTSVHVETFADLSAWGDLSSGTADIVADGTKFTFTCPTGDTNSARLMWATPYKNSGLLLRAKSAVTGGDVGQGFFCPAFRQDGDIIEPFGLATGYVFEVNARDNDLRIVSSQSKDYDGPLFDGVYSYLAEDLSLPHKFSDLTKLWMRLECFEGSVRWKLWEDGSPEPTDWLHTVFDLSISDAGLTGIVYAHNETQDADMTAEIDYLEVYTLQ